MEEVRGRRGSEGTEVSEGGLEIGVASRCCVVAMASSGVGVSGEGRFLKRNVRDRGGDSGKEGKEARQDEDGESEEYKDEEDGMAG